MPPLIQSFAARSTLPDSISPALFGNKAAMLMRMLQVGLPVPPGFVLTTDLCRIYFDHGSHLPDGFSDLLRQGIELIENATGLRFGGHRRSLLVAVRSGAPASMPGMMETILNVGLCDATVQSLIRMTGNPRFVWDSYRRLIQSYAEVVHGVTPAPFNQALHERLQLDEAQTSRELDCLAQRELAQEFLRLYETTTGIPFPQDPFRQLSAAVTAVLDSWNCPRAIHYRRLHGLDDRMGTAVTVQSMVFGNMGSTSGSGVAFTRDPTTGENRLYLDYVVNAQGEDVVSGRSSVRADSLLPRIMPALDDQLRLVSGSLEELFRDAQDFEFTVQEGQLYLLQSRAAKRTHLAALRIACELVQAGVIDARTALERLRGIDLESLQVTRPATHENRPAIAHGIAACPGVAIGPIALEPRSAIALAREGPPPILVRHDISTDDLPGIAAAQGILTTLGGRTSLAAVVARQMNKVCIVGCRDLVIEPGNQCRIRGESFRARDVLSLDGHSGSVYSGPIEFVAERPKEWIDIVCHWTTQVLESRETSQSRHTEITTQCDD